MELNKIITKIYYTDALNNKQSGIFQIISSDKNCIKIQNEEGILTIPNKDIISIQYLEEN